MTNQRTVFFISDRTGITAEALGNSLLSQFENIEFNEIHLSFVDTFDKAKSAIGKINNASAKGNSLPLVFSTQINAEYRELIKNSPCIFFDFFDTFISKMERSLNLKSSHTIGRLHNPNSNDYSSRINSINFSLGSDDGLGSKNYAQADIILIGVSRSGKTPSCLFMALQYGIKAANYPLIDQDLTNTELPEILQPYKNKLFGLRIKPERLCQIREKRKGNSAYASIGQCQREIKRAEDLYLANNISFLDTTQISIEEISAKIISKLSLR
ncbi:MAG: kinase/pyrophosphorylase [Candidatus Thioglobus sp.]|uniref:posphoenolpyruvate synthetase regulatory kinase/phosphorylase PpsR n=1 Tax=Candidatus Thioglobus sp. TaxID=2026721 RepID=UPI0026271D49|nr:pyruvate, water dikinase regulatory protein [Candidatus Thioglobus sp.]MDC9726351.1 kinase/pyrophosphorylase [Candidatus Thioglobus sp.]